MAGMDSVTSRRRAASIGILAAGLILAAAVAVGGEPGAMSARRFAPLPEPLSVRVEIGDDTRENVAARDAVVRALTARGVRVARGDDASLVLWLDGEIRRNVSAPARGGEFSRDAGPGTSRDDPTRRLGAEDGADSVANLLSTGRDAIVTGRRSTPSTDYDRALRYVVNATANDTATGRRVWQGHVRWDGSSGDPVATLARLAPRLVPHLGSSLGETAFDLD